MKTKYFIANENNFEALARLRYEFKEENTNSDQKFINDYIKYLEMEFQLNRIKVFCAEIDNEIIGNINLILVPKSPTPGKVHSHIAYLTNTYIKSEYRNKGIGTELINRINIFAKEQNIELIFVWPSERSVPLYERNGFENENEILENVTNDN